MERSSTPAPVWPLLRPRTDSDLLERTDHTTHCPFKGDASYWSVRGALAESEKRSVCPCKGHSRYLSVAGVEDAAWTYEAPLPDAIKVQGHVCFDDERVEVELGPPRAQLPS